MSSYALKIIISGTCTVAGVETVTVLQETISEIPPVVPVTDLIGEILSLCPQYLAEITHPLTATILQNLIAAEAVSVKQGFLLEI